MSASNSIVGKSFAFTLAEVLITLGIIGVVASITIPSLITKINHMHYRVIYKKTYSSLNQALKYMQEDDVSFDMTPEFTSDGGTHYTKSIGELFKFLATRYYNAPTLCLDKNADKCWVCKDGEAGYINGTGAPKWLGCGKYNYAFIDANGTAYYLYSNSEYPLLIDVNGKRNPNQLGRDRFVFYFSDSTDPKNKYSSNIDSVKALNDIKSKTRWCPQGNCLYSSWIYENK